MKIGIFGGAFNPVHNGHLHLINTLADTPLYPDKQCIDRLLVIPTAKPPHRSGNELASEEDRINMLSLAIDNKKVEISDIEFKLKGKSYTYHTLTELHRLYPHDSLYLFMGSDQLLLFREWYKYEEITKLARVVAISRSDEDSGKIKRFAQENAKLNISIAEYNPVKASSTEVRNRIKDGKSISDLVPEGVEKYIREHGLYV